MAYQAIGRGTSANDGTGDDLRTGAGKVNANFVEIYTKFGDGSALNSDSFVTLTGTETLTNKTLTDPTVDGTTGIQSGSSDNLKISAGNQIVEVRGGGSNPGSITLNCEANTHGQKIIAQAHAAGVTNVLTLPDGADSTLVSAVATQTLTNKTIDGASNTLTNIGNGSLSNSDVTIGATSISLGGTQTTITGLTSISSTTITDGTATITGGDITGVGTLTATTVTGYYKLADWKTLIAGAATYADFQNAVAAL